ncbi:hypothetical protein HM1_0691 [Heliomicrobium modesticaldum Ice1]|uniref:Uncharacterized protein n=1 Tax=Heliobacterium modesticaldum (strain ATCC 51547 / Ice1) TaxID=498761 RepID=B0TBM2_HELMI|nr:hypothetical protein HM1_0691 [Heliomicrobium modesticaldum Ice1]
MHPGDKQRIGAQRGRIKTQLIKTSIKHGSGSPQYTLGRGIPAQVMDENERDHSGDVAQVVDVGFQNGTPGSGHFVFEVLKDLRPGVKCHFGSGHQTRPPFQMF